MTIAPPEFVYPLYIRTTPEKLWNALTDTDIISRYWFGNSVISSWKVGEAVQSFDKHDGTLDWDGKILVSERPGRMVFTFRVEGRNEPASKVTYLIEAAQAVEFGPRGDAIKFTVIHQGFPADSQIVHAVSMGWPGILSNLKTMLESESATPLDLMWAHRSE